MANYTVQSASTLYQGTSAADIFLLNTALGVSVNANDGDDLLTAGSATNFTSANLNGGAGSDTFVLTNTATYSASSVYGGDGADTITISNATTNGLRIFGGSDADSLFAASATIINSTIGGGAGADLISGSFVNYEGTTNQLGSGNDTATFVVGNSFRSSTFELGGGDDVAFFSGVATFTTVGGSSGNDQITIDATQFVTAGGVSIGGGAGSDTININNLGASNAQNASAFGTVQGGGGNDTITLASGGSSLNGLIYGGAGGDRLAVSSIASGANWVQAAANVSTNNILAYSAFSDSTLGSLAGQGTMDIFSGTTTGNAAALMSGQFTTVQQASVTFQAITSGNFANNAVRDSAGRFWFGTNSATLTTLASRVSVLDSDLTVAGAAATFRDATTNNTTYLFVQGGTSGTADDLLIRLNGTTGVAIGNISNSEIALFNNQASTFT